MKSRLRIQIPAFIAVRVVLGTMIRMVYPFAPFFSRGLGIDLALLSRAFTYRSLVGVSGPFLAWVSDSRGRRSGMLLGLLLFIGGTSAVALRPSYPGFVLSLMLTMLGNFVFIPSVQAYLGDRVAYQRRGLALAVTEFGWSLSFILGVPLVGFMISRFGWISPFYFLGGMGVLACGLLVWLLPADPPAQTGKPSLWRNLGQVLTFLPALAGVVMGFLLSAANELVSVVFGVWMEQSFGVQIAVLGATAAVIGVSELSGEALVSVLSDRWGKIRSVAAGILLNSLAAIALPALGRNVPGAMTGLFFFYISFEFALVSAIPLMTEILPPARATMMACFIAGLSLGRALGAWLSPAAFSRGIWGVGIGAAMFNLLALLTLSYLGRRFPSAHGAAVGRSLEG